MAYRWKTNLTGTLPDGHTPDLTITPFTIACGECEQCQRGNYSVCERALQP
ncbi:alcohol dehydrogenase catalytic domain-containing protein [Halomonas axialensis]|nr:alcohol dehydrogenase catalytic domain-containing protein [Halomonas axialensis]MCC4291496.1 alcohol dehydrogenase catalytic domain-containing protein [Halomonas axialensis]